MENFDIIFGKMSNNYYKVEDIMSDLHQQLIEQPENEQLKKLLEGLGNIAESIINEQIDFAYLYCSPDIKENVIGRLQTKKETLISELQKDLSGKVR